MSSNDRCGLDASQYPNICGGGGKNPPPQILVETFCEFCLFRIVIDWWSKTIVASFILFYSNASFNKGRIIRKVMDLFKFNSY